MKRTIKFKAIRADNGKWVYGDLEHNPSKKITRIHSYNPDGTYCGQHIVDSESVCQFVGLYDRYDREIYEGDILSSLINIDDISSSERVIFKDGSFQVDGRHFRRSIDEIDAHARIIIGNIYDKVNLKKLLDEQDY